MTTTMGALAVRLPKISHLYTPLSIQYEHGPKCIQSKSLVGKCSNYTGKSWLAFSTGHFRLPILSKYGTGHICRRKFSTTKNNSSAVLDNSLNTVVEVVDTPHTEQVSSVSAASLDEMLSKVSTLDISDPSMLPISIVTLPAHVWFFIQEEWGIPLWAAMALTTILIRSLSMPSFIVQLRNMAILRLISPKANKINDRITISQLKGDYVMEKYWKDQLDDMHHLHKVSYIKNFRSLIITLPLNTVQMLSARFLLNSTPRLLTEPGPFWLHDMISIDLYYILPVIYVFVQLLIFRINLPMQAGILGQISDIPRWAWAVLTVYISTIAAVGTQLPVILAFIWMPSMLFTLGSNFLFQVPAVCNLFGIVSQLPTKRPDHLPSLQNEKQLGILSK